MQSLYNSSTGKYLTQAAYDAWADDAAFEGEEWGTHVAAAVFHVDDAPPRAIWDGEFVDALEGKTVK